MNQLLLPTQNLIFHYHTHVYAHTDTRTHTHTNTHTQILPYLYTYNLKYDSFYYYEEHNSCKCQRINCNFQSVDHSSQEVMFLYLR